MRVDNHSVYMNSQSYNLQFKETTIQINANNQEFTNDKTEELAPIEVDTLEQNRVHNELTQALTKGVLQNIANEKQKLIGDRVEISQTYAQMQAMNFQLKATVNAEGKTHEIAIDVSLSRSFLQHTSIIVDLVPNLSDPLVLNLNGRMPSIGDGKFSFDIDSDGQSDQISTLAKGSAFLALDKNENGQIDDGSELFGAKSGNGFSDLASYDDDKNGWIDENDAIFDKLRIWEKSEGEDKLVTLGEVGIGAIFLGNIDTPFSMKSEINALNAELRKSGFFMFEDGKAGVISHIDFAVEDETKSKINILEDVKKNLTAMSLHDLYADSESNESQGDKRLGKIKAKIRALESKLRAAPTDAKAGIQAQITALMGEMMALLEMKA